MSALEFLTGKVSTELIPFLNSNYLVHPEMSAGLEALINAAKTAGLDLAITSSFRSYEAQKLIWNEKCQGLRAVLDSNSQPIDLANKSKTEILFLILRWSAIPGGSRHHWGTDLDIYDQKAISADYKIQLIPSEYEEHGPFVDLNNWLNQNMQKFGFFKPYLLDNGGIAPEPWHISFRLLSDKFLESYTYEVFVDHLNQSNFLLIDEARENSREIYQRFINL
ncbi:MAG: M15 family metallopeptidase [Bacteriovorax sp.]|nr:M15 family metallopeptidase [Bacteriovorax sp.]